MNIQTTKDTLPGYSGEITNNTLTVKTPNGKADHVIAIADLPTFYVEAVSMIADLSAKISQLQNHTLFKIIPLSDAKAAAESMRESFVQYLLTGHIK